MMRPALWPVFFLFLLPGYTYAQDVTLLSIKDAGVLKDVGPIAVVVETMPIFFESLGLHEYDIQRDVELKLRIAGITIDNDERDYLYVVLGGMCSISVGMWL